MKVLISVTHLLGTGHLSRALTLGRAFVAAGHQVLVISGGTPAPQLDPGGVDLVQLPPLRSDGTDFSTLLTPEGSVAGETWLAARRLAQREALARFAPDILITELYPFGRRSLSGEFLDLIHAVETMPRRPLVLSSIRDILAPPSKPSKVTHTDEILARHYDAVLVHSDPHATRLEASWPVSPMLAAKLRYTGYVAPPAAGPHPDGAGTGEILVTAGGGAVGNALFACAIGAARLSAGKTWRLLVGGGPNRVAALGHAATGTSMIVEAPRPDFRQMLRHAAASVSMCGYNTTLDLLQAGTPAVLVPFDDGREVEQTLRAQSLASLPGIEVLASAGLTPDRLSDAVGRMLRAGRRGDIGLRFDGAARSVGIACSLAEARP